MIRRPLVLAFSGLVGVLALSAAACSDDKPIDGRSESVGSGSDSTDAKVRDDIARAAVFAHRCSGTEGEALESCARDVAEGASHDAAWMAWEREVKSWSQALDHAAICRALEAHRGKSRVYWAVGQDSVGAQREIVFDITKGQAAVFAYRTSGARNVLDGSPGAYQTVAFAKGDARGLVEAWSKEVGGLEGAASAIDVGADARSWTSSTIEAGFIARLPAERASAIKDLIGVDGSKYGDVPAASKVATAALAKTLAGIEHTVDGDVLTFEATSAAGLGRGGATAAAILRWAGGHNAASVHAAIIAVASAEIDARGSTLDAHCSGGAPLRGLTAATDKLRPLAVDGGDAGAPVSLPDLPDPPKTATTDASSTPDCSNDAELDCAAVFPGQDKVCSQNGPKSCCVTAAPVTQLCQKHEDCAALGPEAQCVKVQNAAADGRLYTCQAKPDDKRCSAVFAARPAESGGLCSEDTPYNGKGTYTYRNPYASRESLRQRASEGACRKADDAAVSACYQSPWFCKATPGKPFHSSETKCTEGVLETTCTCVATVNCSYSSPF